MVPEECVAFPAENSGSGSGSVGESSASTGSETEGATTSGPGGSMSESAGSSGMTTVTSGLETSATTSATDPFCGDGVVNGDEECDDGDVDNEDYCVSGCKDAVCGDGFVSPVEDCDDQNSDNEDGCNNVCARDRIVFVTSGAYNGYFGGFVGATNTCRSLAYDAGFENPLQFFPWLSDGEFYPSLTFYRSKGRYVLPDMVTVIADDWDDLTDGELQNPIDTDENGVWLDGTITWTATLPSGLPNPEMEHCSGWSVGGEWGGWGYTGLTDLWWTAPPEASPQACGNYARLYCFEQR
jgi:cysteine-rich repeat protein